ncbi:T9SS type A sorting domain-containing protein [Polaribacter sargassicola]|uniref:T9SS type A sorting domain-containing protein n=1 Tax=Polaribacter sargassicola TaxID=2836891 RepID=UPI001F1F2969|nr:T9SS type A sorting domain-containing protein [Polaribacter sp. DS7-9]MCG1034926.1 T9SS type A sorting domain-containing protein [Polaribacter sp. DS7-9]
MTKNYLSITTLLILFLFIAGCQQQNKETKNDLEAEKIITYASSKLERKKKNKESIHKKGIEHIADYQEQIRKGIDEERSSYKKGYLMEEFNKAKQKSALKKASTSITAVFTERGPNNVPGRSRGIAIDPNNSDKWFVGTVGGGVWLTENGGISWSALTDFKIPNLSTSTVVISKTNSNIIYAGTGEPFGNLGAIGGSGVFKSTDAGTTWQHLTTTASLGDVGRIIINPEDDNNVIIATDSGIYRTVNGGTSWSQTYESSGRRVQDLDADPSDFNIQYGSVNNLGLVKSLDGGITWSVIFDKDATDLAGNSVYNSNHSRFETSVSPADSNVLFVSVYSSSGATVGTNTDFYVSRDKGVTFTILTTTDSNANLLTGQGWYDNVIMAHPYNTDVFYVGGVAVFKVTVVGNTFTSTSIASGYDSSQINSDVHVDQHGIFSVLGDSNEFKILLANDGGVYSTSMSTDPGAIDGDFSDNVVGKNSTQFYSAAKQNGADNYLAGAQDNGTWISTGSNASTSKNYSSIWGGDGFEPIWHYNNAGNYLAVSQYNYVVRYVDNRGPYYGTFSESNDSSVSPFYSKLSNANNNPDVVFSVTSNGVWRSVDFAENWALTSISNNFTPSVSSALNVKVSTANPNVVWAGAAMTESGSYVLHVSEDNGKSFTGAGVYDNPNNTHNLYISGIATSYTEQDRAYALFSNQGRPKILKTEDLGESWTDITGFENSVDTGFPDVAVHSVLEMPFDKDIIWAGTDIGLFQTEDGGANWSMITDLPSVAVYDMKIVNDQVVIATYGRGIWSATISELSDYQLPEYLGFAEASVQQKGIEGTSAIVSYTVPSDNISSVKIFIDDIEQIEITQDFNKGVTYTYETLEVLEGSHQLGIQAFDDTNNLETPISKEEFFIINFDDASTSIQISQFEETDIFTDNSEFVIDNLGGAIIGVALNNSDHFYNNSETYSVLLKKPLIISESNKTFTYEDFAIVEPYTDDLTDLDSFYDYVIIEASSDLSTWKTLDKYDARRFDDWLAEYNKGTAAAASDALFKEQSIILTDKGFNIGDTVVFRFSLVTDPGANSYGWAIKSINETATASVDEVIAGSRAFTVYPTISNGDFTLYAKNSLGKSNVSIYSLTGKKVFTTAVDFTLNEKQKVSVNLNTGVYIVDVIDENDKKSSTKIIIE